MQLLQASIGGFSGVPSTVIAGLDEKGVIQVLKGGGIKDKRLNDAIVITDQQSIYSFDVLFDNEVFKTALSAFRRVDARGCLVFSSTTVAFKPQVQIESFSENGAKISVSPDITNEQICVIAICYLAELNSPHQDVCNAYG